MLSWHSFLRTAVVAVAVAAIASIGLRGPESSSGPADVIEDSTAAVPPKAQLEEHAVPEIADKSADDVVAALPETTTKSFGMVGVTWEDATGPEDITVQVRTRTAEDWGKWQELHIEPSEGEGGRGGTEPLWVGKADGVAVKITSSSGEKPEDIKIATIDPGETGLTESSVTTAAYTTTSVVGGSATALSTSTAAVPQPAIILRSSWGATAGGTCDSPVYGATTMGAVIHHTAGNNTYTKSESASIVRATQKYHVDGRDWCDIGYNFLVDKYGQIFEGRNGGISLQVRAAHSGNNEINTYAMGVAMAGNFEKIEPSAALKDSMVKLLGWRMGTTYMSAKGTYSVGETITASSRTGPHTMNRIAGHRNVVSTACPGAKGYAWISAAGGLRDRVAAYIANYSSPMKTYAASLGVATTGVVYRGEYPTLSGRRAIFTKMDLYWSPAGGAHLVSKEFLTEYRRLGSQTSPLQFPTGNPTSTSNLKVATQHFQQGNIYRITQSNGSRRAFALWDSVATTYTQLGEYGGQLGVPTSSVITSSTGNLRANFAKGYITYTASTKAAAAYNSAGAKMATTAASDFLTVPSSRKFTLTGHGYGHGIGMSQYGAQGAALKGKTYDYILGYYYKGTALGTKTGNIRVLLSKDTTPDVVVKARIGLQFRNVMTNKITKLPAKVGSATVAQWRIVPVTAAPTTSTLQYKTTAWHSYNVSHWTGDAQFESPGTFMSVVMPNGSSSNFREIVRSAVPKKGSTDRDTVNMLTLENYVRGVISAEMPSLWKSEALKAQAVAARTFGVRGLTPTRSYDLCDTTACQVYKGVSAETKTTDAAVKATSGKIVTYQSKPAFTQFSSSSGGRTTAGSQPYLIEAPDGYDDYAANPVHNWKISIAASTMEKKWPTIGTLKTIKVTKRTGHGDFGGRVVSATLTGSKGSKTVTGNDLRFGLGLRSNWFGFN